MSKDESWPRRAWSRLKRYARKARRTLFGESRRRNKINWFYFGLIYFVVIFYSFLGAYLFISLANVAILNSNKQGFTMNAGIGFDVSNQSVASSDMVIVGLLNSSTPNGLQFTAQFPIGVNVSLYVNNPALVGRITRVYFGFETEGIVKGSSTAGYPLDTLLVLNQSARYTNLYSECCQTITFPAQGNFSPLLFVVISGNLVQAHEAYSNFALPISPTLSYQQALYDQLGLYLTLAIFIFGLVESVKLIHDIFPLAFPPDYIENGTY